MPATACPQPLHPLVFATEFYCYIFTLTSRAPKVSSMLTQRQNCVAKQQRKPNTQHPHGQKIHGLYEPIRSANARKETAWTDIPAILSLQTSQRNQTRDKVSQSLISVHKSAKYRLCLILSPKISRDFQPQIVLHVQLENGKISAEASKRRTAQVVISGVFPPREVIYGLAKGEKRKRASPNHDSRRVLKGFKHDVFRWV